MWADVARVHVVQDSGRPAYIRAGDDTKRRPLPISRGRRAAWVATTYSIETQFGLAVTLTTGPRI